MRRKEASSHDFFPKKSEAYLAGEPVVFAPFNDVHFFVEDESCENLYLEILTKFFPSLTITKVFSRNGKDTIIKEARNNNQRIRVHVYIVDLDFDGLLSRKLNLRGLFYLERFCIENYLLEETAFIDLLTAMNPKVKKCDLRQQFDFPKQIDEYVNVFRELYALFAISREFGLQHPTVGNHYSRYLPKNVLHHPDQSRVKTLRAHLKQELAARCPNIDTLAAHYEAIIGVDHTHISGKHILDSFLKLGAEQFRAKRIFDRESATILLAQRASISSLTPVIDQIRSYISDEVSLRAEQKGSG